MTGQKLGAGLRLRLGTRATPRARSGTRSARPPTDPYPDLQACSPFSWSLRLPPAAPRSGAGTRPGSPWTGSRRLSATTHSTTRTWGRSPRGSRSRTLCCPTPARAPSAPRSGSSSGTPTRGRPTCFTTTSRLWARHRPPMLMPRVRFRFPAASLHLNLVPGGFNLAANLASAPPCCRCSWCCGRPVGVLARSFDPTLP